MSIDSTAVAQQKRKGLRVAASTRAAIGLVLVNLFGGVLASIAYAVLTLRPSLLSIFVIVLVVTLLLGGRAAARSKDAPVFAGALTICSASGYALCREAPPSLSLPASSMSRQR
jgi:hypothetical protein